MAATTVHHELHHCHGRGEILSSWCNAITPSPFPLPPTSTPHPFAGPVRVFCDVIGSWLPLLCIMNCTTVTEEVRPVVQSPLCIQLGLL